MPDATGRYCAVCTKSVHDFTGRPKEELLAFLLCSTQSPCVRMLASQSNFTPEEVQATAQKLIRSGRVIPAAALALVMLLATGCGTEGTKPEKQSTDPTSVAPSMRPHYLQNIEAPPPILPTMGFVAPVLPPVAAPKPICPPEPVVLGEPVVMGAPPMPAPPDTEIMGDVIMPPTK